MKQEIICPDCQIELRKLFSHDNPYPGEHVKFVRGEAKQDFVCDHCGKRIPEDSSCCAFSAWADYGGVKYWPWEGEFIEEYKEKSPSERG